MTLYQPPSRAGAALIMALIILTVMLLLGLPFVLSQARTRSGAMAHASALSIDQARQSAEDLGLDLAQRLSQKQLDRVDNRENAWSDPVGDLQQILDNPDARFSNPATGEIHIDLPAWTSNNPSIAGLSTRISVSIEDLSGRLDINALNAQLWQRLLHQADIADWDDNEVLDSESGSRETDDDDSPGPTMSGQTPAETGELAEALAEYRFGLPGKRYSAMEQLLDAATAKHRNENNDNNHHNNPKQLPGPFTYPRQADDSFGLRSPLSTTELARLRPYLLTQGNTLGRQGEMDLGSAIFWAPLRWDSGGRLPDIVPGLLPLEKPGTQVLNNESASDTQHADPWFSTAFTESYYQSQTDASGVTRRIEPPNTWNSTPQHNPAIVTPVSPAVNLNLRDDEDANGLNVRIQNMLYGLTFQDYQPSLPLTTRAELPDAITDNASLPQTITSGEFPLTATRSNYLYAIRSSATAQAPDGTPLVQRKRRIVAQIPPQGKDILFDWTSQDAQEELIRLRHHNLLTSWPTAHPRIRSIAADTRVDLGGLRPAALLNPLRPWLGADDWKKELRTGQEFTSDPLRGSLQENDLRPDGAKTQGALAYAANTALKPVQDSLVNSAHPLAPFTLGFWYTPEPIPSREVTLWESRAPIPNLARHLAGLTSADWGGKPYQHERKAAPAGSQHRIALSYDPAIQCFVLRVYGLDSAAPEDYGPKVPSVDGDNLGSEPVYWFADAQTQPGGNTPLAPKRGSEIVSVRSYYPLIAGVAVHVQAVLRSADHDGVQLLLNQCLGRRLDTLTTTQLADFSLLPGDYLLTPTPLRLKSELPRLTRSDNQNSVDLSSVGTGSDSRREWMDKAWFQQQAVEQISAQALPDTVCQAFGLVDGAAWLQPQGLIRIGDEFVGYEQYSKTSAGEITFRTCVRGRRVQVGQKTQDVPNPDLWSGRDARFWFPELPAHELDTRILPGGFTATIASTKFYQGGAAIKGYPMYDTEVASEASPSNQPSLGTAAGITITLEPIPLAWQRSRGVLRLRGPKRTATGGLDYDGSMEYVFYENRSGNQLTITHRNLPGSSPGGPKDFVLYDESSRIRLWVEDVGLEAEWPAGYSHSEDPTNPGDWGQGALSEFYQPSYHFFQLSKNDGTLEWIEYAQVIDDPTNEPSLWFYAWDSWHSDGTSTRVDEEDRGLAGIRGQLGTQFHRGWDVGRAIVPVQARDMADMLEPGDRVTLYPKDITLSLPVQAVVRHVVRSAYRRIIPPYNGTTNGEPGIIKGSVSLPIEHFFTFTDQVPSLAVERLSVWPGFSPETNYSRRESGARYVPPSLPLSELMRSDPTNQDDRQMVFLGEDTRPKFAGDTNHDSAALLDHLSIAPAPGTSVKIHTIYLGPDSTEQLDNTGTGIAQAVLETEARIPDQDLPGLYVIDGEVVALTRASREDTDKAVRMIGRGLLGSSFTTIKVAMRLRFLPVGPIAQIAPQTNHDLTNSYNDKPLDPSFHWRLQVDRMTDGLRDAPAVILAKPDGTAYEIALPQRYQGDSFLYLTPWLRGAYNGTALDKIEAPISDEEPRTLVIACWPRFPSALPNDWNKEGGERAHWKEQFLRSRAYPFATFPARLQQCQFAHTTDDPFTLRDPPLTLPSNVRDTFRAELRVLTKGYDWSLPTVTVKDAGNPNEVRDLFANITEPTDGADVRLHWIYNGDPEPLATNRQEAAEYLQKQLIRAGQAPATGGALMRTRAPIVVLEANEE